MINDGKLGVEGVTPGGPAARAGVVVGDKILAIDTRTVAELTPELANDMLDSEHVAAGQVVTLKLSRTPPVDIAVTADPLEP
jgi:C-terminal processing protease CtpA/Prc